MKLIKQPSTFCRYLLPKVVTMLKIFLHIHLFLYIYRYPHLKTSHHQSPTFFLLSSTRLEYLQILMNDYFPTFFSGTSILCKSWSHIKLQLPFQLSPSDYQEIFSYYLNINYKISSSQSLHKF